MNNNIIDNVTLTNSLWGLKESRCSFNTFKNEDKNDSKAGIRCHNAITAFFLRIFGKKIETVKTKEGKTIYLNKNSLKKWKNAHNFGDLPLNQIIQNVRTVKVEAARKAREKTKEEAKLAAKNAKTEEKREKLERLNKEKATLKEALKGARAERVAEEANLNSLKTARTMDKNNSNIVISSFQEALISKNEKRTRLEESHKKLKTKLESVKNAYEKAKQAVTDIESAVNGTDKAKIQYLRNEITGLEREKSNFQAELTKRQGELKATSKKSLLSIISAIQANTDKKVKPLKNGIETREKEIRKLTRLTKNQKQRNEFLTANQRVRESAKSGEKTLYDQLAKEEEKKREELNETVTLIEQQINVLLLKNAEKNSKLTELDKEIRESESKIGKLSADIEAKETRLVEIKSSLPEAGKSLLNVLVGGDLEESENPVRGDDSKVDDANPEPVPAKELTAEEKIIAKNQGEVKKALAAISSKVNQDVADIVQALTDKFINDPSVQAEWFCIDENIGEYVLQLNKPIRLWIRPSVDNKPNKYDKKTPRGVVLLIGDNDQYEFGMILKKNEIEFTSGFKMRCEFHKKIIFNIDGNSSGEFTKLSYDTRKNVATTFITARPDKPIAGISEAHETDVKLKKTVIADWENGIVIPDNQDFEEFLHSQTAAVNGILPSEQAS